jgi:hypothetical protein
MRCRLSDQDVIALVGILPTVRGTAALGEPAQRRRIQLLV